MATKKKATTKKTASAPRKKAAAPAARAPKKAAAPAAAAAAAPAPTGEVLLVGSKVRQAVKDAGCNFGGDAMEGLNHWVQWLIKQATQRAHANGRKTVRAHDFMIAP